MTVSDRLKRASRRMAFWSKGAVVVAPTTTALLFLFPDQVKAVGGAFSITVHYGHLLANVVPLPDRLLALAFAMVPTAVATFGIVALVRLFECFSRGEIFSAESLRAVWWIAAALFWNVIASLATEPLIAWSLSRTTHPGHSQITLAYDDLELLFLAGVVFVIARMMSEVRDIAEENAKFV